MNQKTIITILFSLSLFVNSILIAFVYDLEYVGPEKRYEVEKGAWERSHSEPFISFGQWADRNESQQERFNDWFVDGINSSFDWNGSSQSAEAPNNWANVGD